MMASGGTIGRLSVRTGAAHSGVAFNREGVHAVSRLRIVLMGAGLIGREHATLVQTNSSTELVGIADIAPGGKRYAQSVGVPHYEDFEAMLDDLRPDGAIVALPNTMHVSAGLACIRRNIPSL